MPGYIPRAYNSGQYNSGFYNFDDGDLPPAYANSAVIQYPRYSSITDYPRYSFITPYPEYSSTTPYPLEP